MSTGDDRQYEISGSFIPPFGEDPLRGEDFDRAQAYVKRAHETQTTLLNMMNSIRSGILVAEGQPPAVIGIVTPEGAVMEEIPYVPLERQDIPDALRQHNDLGFAYDALASIVQEAEVRMWQESGSRLFQKWRQGELAPVAALSQLAVLIDTYTPDDFYADCATTQEEVQALFLDALAKYQTSVAGFQFDPEGSHGNFIEGIKMIASVISLDADSLGL